MSVCWHFYGTHISYIVSPDGVEVLMRILMTTGLCSVNDWSTWRGQRKSAKLVGVIKRTLPRMKGFKRGLKINTWTLDQCLTLKDQPAQKLADGDKVCTYTYVHITGYPCQMSWLLHIDFPPPPSGCKPGPWLKYYRCECLVTYELGRLETSGDTETGYEIRCKSFFVPGWVPVPLFPK